MALCSIARELITVKIVGPIEGSLLVIKGEDKLNILMRDSSKIIKC
jgi:hypothetical protein